MATKTKRLFLVAGYDRDACVDETLVYYLRALGKCGDIVFVMDNDIAPADRTRLAKIPGVLHVMAMAHGEYDFGSYRRAWEWARGKKILDKYDWVYMANDSVYGPFRDMGAVLESLEQSGADFIGISQYGADDICRHVGTYFCGISRRIVATDFFMHFMDSVSGKCNHDTAVYKYEMRLSQMILNHGYDIAVLDVGNGGGHEIYDRPLAVMARGVPFIKKRSIHLIGDMEKLIPFADDTRLLDYIGADMRRRGVGFENVRYKKVFRLSVLGIPLWVVRRKCAYAEYKGYLFGVFPIIKWTKPGRP